MKKRVKTSDIAKNKAIIKNSKRVILSGKLEDVRGYVGEVSMDLDSLSHNRITGFVQVRIASDETSSTFEGEITGARQGNKIRFSYVSRDSPITFNYEGNLIELGKGVGITGSYKAASKLGKTFLRAGVLSLIEIQALPAVQQSMSTADSIDQHKVYIENQFKKSREK